MSTLEIERLVRYVNDSHGRSIEVLVPYKLFKDLLELKTSMEIYEKPATRRSLTKVRQGKTRSFKTAAGALQWLKQ
jgi:stage III sporulation protein SpoIIIAA